MLYNKYHTPELELRDKTGNIFRGNDFFDGSLDDLINKSLNAAQQVGNWKQITHDKRSADNFERDLKRMDKAADIDRIAAATEQKYGQANMDWQNRLNQENMGLQNQYNKEAAAQSQGYTQANMGLQNQYSKEAAAQNQGYYKDSLALQNQYDTGKMSLAAQLEAEAAKTGQTYTKDQMALAAQIDAAMAAQNQGYSQDNINLQNNNPADQRMLDLLLQMYGS